MPYIEVDGLPLMVDKIGKGPAVVLLHGFASEGRPCRPLVWTLDREFATISLDLVGHNTSGSPIALTRYEMPRVVDDLVALIHTLGFERAAWVGHGLGGNIALQVAVRHPEATWAIALEAASPGIEDAEARTRQRTEDEALASRLETNGLSAFVDEWEALPIWESQRRVLSPQQLEALHIERLSQRAKGLANVVRGMGLGAQEWVGDRLPQVTIPALLLAGSLDTAACDAARGMAASLPNATVTILEGAGHTAHLEQPEAFNEAVLAFLREAVARD
ncbi:MAG: alpha/beta fold hydrolase [Chloroflexota bacterium]